MATSVNFHTSRKGTILHNTTYNAGPRLRRYFVLWRPEISQIENIELLKCFELSTSIFTSENYPAWTKNDESISLAEPLLRNVLVSVLFGPTELIEAERARLSAYGSLWLWVKNVAGFEILVVSTPTKRVGGDVICDATRYYSSVHETEGVGAYKEDFVYYL